MGKEEIARDEQCLLCPQCFLLNQKIESLSVNIFDIISLFAAELEEPTIGMWGKRLMHILILLPMYTDPPSKVNAYVYRSSKQSECLCVQILQAKWMPMCTDPPSKVNAYVYRSSKQSECLCVQIHQAKWMPMCTDPPSKVKCADQRSHFFMQSIHILVSPAVSAIKFWKFVSGFR